MPIRLFAYALLSCTALFIGACSKSSSSSTGTVSLAVKVADASRALDERSFATTDSRSFTPSNFMLPIMKISIAKIDGTMEQVIYQCPGATEADCLVDLASQTELDALSLLARNVTAQAGTYDVVTVNTCRAGSSGSDLTIAKIKGGGLGPNGNNWTTKTTGLVTTDGTGTAELTNVGSWPCASKPVIVKSGIEVGTAPLTLTVVVDNYMAGVFGSTVSGGMGGCKVADGSPGGPGLCVTYPALMAFVGTESANTRRFSIAHDNTGAPMNDSKANALIIVALQENGTPLMAYGRTLFTATSVVPAANTKASSLMGTYTLVNGGPTYVTETNYQSFAVAADGKISFMQGGSEDTFAAKFAAFDPTATHTGTVTSRDGADSWHYLATLIP